MRRKWVLPVVWGVALAAVLAGIHHWHGRADRIAAEAARLNLLSVRDQILRFEFQTGQLPTRLDELVPLYLRRDQIKEEGGYRFRYDRSGRWIEEAAGAHIRGIISHRLRPRGIDLPAPERPAVKVAAAHENPAPKTAPVVPPPLAPTLPKVQRTEPPRKEPVAATPSEPVAPPIVIGRRPRSTDESTTDDTPAARESTARALKHAADVAAAPDLTAAFQAPVAPHLSAAPPGCLVFEAEHYTETNYGWEVRADADAAGGAYLHCKEGIANVAAQTLFGVGNFYDLRSKTAQTFLRYHLNLPASGTYYVYGRMWTTDTLCSNFLSASFDRGGPRIGGMGNRTPFRWVWSELKDNPVYLRAGDHFLHLFIHEDGIKLDQFILSPQPLSDGQAYQANFLPGNGTRWAAQTRAAHLSFDYKGMAFSEKMPPEVNLVLRRLKPATEKAVLRVALCGAGADGADVVLCNGAVDLSAVGEISHLPLSFRNVDLKNMPRREYRLHATLTGQAGVISDIELPLLKPFAWELFGPGGFLTLDQRGPLDGDSEPKPQDTRKWTPFADTSWQLFGVMDFGLHSTGNSLHPEQDLSIYARTKINVPETGQYLFKIQSDDQMILWLDGSEIFRFRETHPVTRTAQRLVVNLTQGEHRLRMRVNQFKGRWQAMLRIRTLDDDVSPVTGVE